MLWPVPELQVKYARQSASKPVYQLFSHLNQLMDPRAYNVENKCRQLSQIKLQDVTQLHRVMFAQSNIHVLFAGHWSTATLYQLQQKIHDVTLRNDRAKPFCNDFIVNQNKCERYVKQATDHPDYARVHYVYSTSTDIMTTICFMLAEQVLAGVFFSTMRETAPRAYLCGNHYLPHGSAP